jgi:hypothetical protein
MVWRGNISPMDRLLACLPYLLPMVQALPLGNAVFGSIPVLAILVSPLVPLFPILEGNMFVSFAIFIALYILVVRNERISHFIRFNTGQALIMGIALSLAFIVFQYILSPLFAGLRLGMLEEILLSALFLGTYGISIFAFIQNAMGRYAEVPTLSEAAYMQVR